MTHSTAAERQGIRRVRVREGDEIVSRHYTVEGSDQIFPFAAKDKRSRLGALDLATRLRDQLRGEST